MKQYCFLLILSFISLHSSAQITSFTSIEELAKNKKIEVELKSLGGYQGDVVQIDITNLTSEELHIWLESGRRLDNLNNAQQDILVVKSQKFNLNAKKNTTITAYGFCCQAHNGAPQADQEFSLGSMEKDNLLWIAQYLNDHPVISADVMQHAIWVFSNGNNIGSMMLSNEEAVIDLKREMCKKLGIEVPWYEIYYEKDTTAVFSNVHYKLKGPIQYSLPNRGWLKMVIRNSSRQMVYNFTNTAFVEGGVYNYDIDLSIKDWLKGKYNIEIYLDDILKKQISFTL
jgi:hypothetical protein